MDRNIKYLKAELPVDTKLFNTPQAWFEKGVEFINRGDFAEAEVCFKNALKLAPHSLEAQLNLGYVLGNDPDRHEEALHCFESVLAISPDCAEARYNRGVHLLRQGDYINGFNNYEARFAVMKEIDRRVYTQPMWDGSPLNGRTILVFCEQGLGDAIMFARYIPLLSAKGGRIVLEVQPPLLTLLASVTGVYKIIARTSSLPVTDCYIRLLSLPYLFKTQIDSLPCQTPYITVPEHLVTAWQERIGTADDRYRVGLVWACKGRPLPNRTCPPDNLAPLLALSNIHFVSLQVGEKEHFPLPEELASHVLDVSKDFRDFSDTAAVIMNLDLVITVDAAVAHLAGALGKKVWLLLPRLSDWRWLLERSDSPWYPTMRIFRQPTEGDWQTVIAEVVGLLQNQLSQQTEANQYYEKTQEFTCRNTSVNPEPDHQDNKFVHLEQMNLQSCYDLGVKLKESGKLSEAERCFRRTVKLAPNLPDPHYCLGVVLQLQGQEAEAISHYQRAVKLDPKLVPAYYNLAHALHKCERYSEAISANRSALKLKPDYTMAYYNLGNSCHESGDLVEAEKAYRKALLLDPGLDMCKWNLSLLMLLQGRFEEGLLLHESRFTGGGKATFAAINKVVYQLQDYKRWHGEPVKERELLVIAEQGIGDNLMMMRYLPLLKRQGLRKIIVYCDNALQRIFSQLPGVDDVIPFTEPLPFGRFDLYCLSMSLPYLFQTRVETIPSKTPYLEVPRELQQKWQIRFADITDVKVGLVWAGKESYRKNSTRSISLQLFTHLLEIAGVRFFSVQKGEEAAQLKELAAHITDWMDDCCDLLDTAALIENLDLLISVDTAVAHLAGALGKPVWLLNRYNSDWRWLLDREDSPWYPTMRLFRQKSPGKWQPVIEQIKMELGDLLQSSEILNQRGVKLLESGQDVAAELLFDKAVKKDPNSAEAHANRGAALDSQKRHTEALECYRAAIKIKPDYMQAFFNMGNTCKALGNIVGAISCYEQALKLSADFVPALLCLGEACKESGRFVRAVDCFSKAAKIEPNNAYAYQELGSSLQSLEDFPKAIRAYQQAIAIEPERATAYNMMGLAHHHSGDFVKAESCFHKALALTPDNPALLNNLGTLHNSNGRTEEEIELYRQAIAIDPTCEDAHWNLALALLVKGEFKEGWQEYEWRFIKKPPVPSRNFPQPRWDGSSLNGKTILLHCEQGFGDTIQFARYAPLVAQNAEKVIIECQSVILKRLLTSLAGVEVLAAGDPLPPFDFHLPLLSLPFVFDTRLETIPATVPYLSPAASDVEAWRLRLGTTDKFRVGIVWFARQNQILNRKRSCQLSEFTPLTTITDCEFYNLQIGIGTEQLVESDFGRQLIDVTADLHDFAETAAFMMNLDLVISIDTAAAHLAGAIGAPVWTILPFGAEWRWLEQRHDSPWYPTMRLFRQPVLGDWHTVLHEVQKALQTIIRTHLKSETK